MSTCHIAVSRSSEKQKSMESQYSLPPKVTSLEHQRAVWNIKGARKHGYLHMSQDLSLGGACSLKKTSIDWMKKVIITSSSSLPSLRVGGIPGCLAINSSIKLWVAWSLYKHTKGNSYDSQCSELYRENLLLLRHTEH